MSLGVAPNAGFPGEENGTPATEVQDFPIRQYVLPVVWKLQCHLNPEMGGQFTVENATPKCGNLGMLIS